VKIKFFSALILFIYCCFNIDRIAADVFLYSLRKCCGEEFTEQADIGWKKVLSRILDVVIPVASQFEMANQEFMETQRGIRYSDKTIMMAAGEQEEEQW